MANHSRDSSIISLHSLSTEISSIASSLTLVDGSMGSCSSSKPSPSIPSMSPMGSGDRDPLIPRPLLPLHHRQSGFPGPQSVRSVWWLDKPLPRLPQTLAPYTHQPKRSDSPPPPTTARSHISSRPAQRRVKHYSLPQIPRPHHQAVLDRAFERAGFPPPTHASLRGDHPPASLEILRPGPQRITPSASPAASGPLIVHQSRRVQFCDERPAQDHPTPSSLPSPGLSRNDTRTWKRALRWLWRPQLSYRRRWRPRKPPASADPPGTIARCGPLQHPQPPPARVPPSRPVTRVKRVLSALLDERISLDLRDSTDVAELDRLLQKTRYLLLNGLQPLGYRTSGRPTVSPPGAPPPTTQHATLSPQGIHELDGRPAGLPFPPDSPPRWQSTMHRIMQHVDSLDDLFALALVNQAAYHAFQGDALALIKATVWRISPPAWELRQVMEERRDLQRLPGGPSLAAALYLRHYQRDLDRLTAIKALLHRYCKPYLRDETLIALYCPDSARGAQINAALWRVSTFCELFGQQKGREHDIQGQECWLRGETLHLTLPPVCHTSPDPSDFHRVFFDPPDGFAQGNLGGLTRAQLFDMLEVWTAMGTLLDFFQRDPRRKRHHVLFNRAPAFGRCLWQEKQTLEAWLDFIRTLGPAAIVELAPCGPNSDPEIAFARAHANGWTHYIAPPPGSLRSNFLTGILTHLLRTTLEDVSEKPVME